MTLTDDTSPATRTVVVFAKAAQPGRVKTRLTDVLSETEAASLYEAFLVDLADGLAEFRREAEVPTDVFLAHAGADDHASFAPFRRHGIEFVDQGDGDLGDRMARVTRRCFEAGADRVAVIGSDSPTLGRRHLEAAFGRLREAPVVLGPSFDGGYYLMGLNQPRPEIFADIDWSSPRVLEQTLGRCRDHDLLCDLLEFWYDVDTFEDLYRLQYHVLDYLEAVEQPAVPATAQHLRQLRDDGVFDANETQLDSQ